MTPCSSGNSPTMPVERSALASSAARTALAASAPGTCGAIVVDQPHHAPDLVEHAAELGVEHALGELGHARGERHLAVLVPEETRVGQPRAQHALVAGDDRLAAIRGLHVGDDQEVRREPPVTVEAGKIFLVRAHRGGQHLWRQIHEIADRCGPSAPPAIRRGRVTSSSSAGIVLHRARRARLRHARDRRR